MLPTESIVINAAGSLASQSASVRRPLSLTFAARPRSATLVQKAVSNNSLVKSSSPFGFHNFSRGTLIGVGKGRSGVRDVLPMSPTKDTDISPSHSYYSSHGSNLPSLLQEEEDVLHDRVESRASSRPQSGKLSRSVSRPESASNSRPTSGGMNRSRSREAWALGSFSRGNERRHNSNMSVLVSRAVVSEHYRLLLGACTDGMLRVWDLNSGEVICSCELIHSAEEIKAIKERGDQMHYQHDDSESAICKLALSEKSNHVIGGYDDGLVRVWLMGPHSTGQLRTVTITDTGELAIPPLQFHIEWLAHDTAISGVEVVNRETPSGGFSSYIVTSGQAQGVYMWTINGKLVGTFGASEWVISDSLTWRPKPIDAAELKLSQNTYVK